MAGKQERHYLVTIKFADKKLNLAVTTVRVSADNRAEAKRKTVSQFKSRFLSPKAFKIQHVVRD